MWLRVARACLICCGVKRKRNTKRLRYTGNLKRCLLILDLKPFRLVDQRKAFYKQRIPAPSCARKETADIDILVTSRNGDRIFMQSIRITSRPPSRIKKWNQLSHFI